MGKRKVSIQTVAEEAGVSPSTVSRVLTGNAPVNPEKREKIEAIINKYNYRPNYASGASATTAKKILGIVLPDVTHPYYGEAFVGAEAMALENGYGTLLGNTMNDRQASGHEMETMLFDLMIERNVSGLLLLGGSLDDENMSDKKAQQLCNLGSRIPLLTPGVAKPSWGGSTLVWNSSSIKRAAHYLLSLKHRRLGFLGGEPGINPTETRRHALIEAIEDADLPFRPEWFVYSGFSIEDGVTAMERLLQNREIPTAIMCVNDLVAVGVMHTAQKHGLRVPGDISIIGFDNIPLSKYLSPTLTTIDLKPREVGRMAAELLIDAIEKRGRSRHLVIETELVIRDSCRRALD